MSLISRARDLATNTAHTTWLIPLLLVLDAALCGVIIEKVPCTCPSHLTTTKSRTRVKSYETSHNFFSLKAID